MAFVTVNWLAIVMGAVAAWLFGGIYYTSTSRYWMAAQGKTMESCQAEMAGKSTAQKIAPFIVVFVSEIIIGWAMYGIMVHMGTFTLRAGIIGALLLWFGFVMTTMATNNAFAGRKCSLTVIDGIAWLGAFVIIGAIVGWMGR